LKTRLFTRRFLVFHKNRWVPVFDPDNWRTTGD